MIKLTIVYINTSGFPIIGPANNRRLAHVENEYKQFMRHPPTGIGSSLPRGIGFVTPSHLWNRSRSLLNVTAHYYGGRNPPAGVLIPSRGDTGMETPCGCGWSARLPFRNIQKVPDSFRGRLGIFLLTWDCSAAFTGSGTRYAWFGRAFAGGSRWCEGGAGLAAEELCNAGSCIGKAHGIGGITVAIFC